MYIYNEDFIPLDIRDYVYNFLQVRSLNKPVEVFWGNGIGDAVFLYPKEKTRINLAFIDDERMTKFAVDNIAEIESRFDYILTNSEYLLEYSNKFINYENKSS